MTTTAIAPNQKDPTTHVNETLDTQKEIRGNSRKPSDAPAEVQQKCIDIIIEEGRKLGFPVRDIAYYIAIAKHESGFNPDAANPTSTASGIAQLIDKTAKTYGVSNANRFNARDNIRAGMSYFADIKKKIIGDYGRADGEYEPMIYFLYHYGEFYHYRDRQRAKWPYSVSELREKYEKKFKEAESVQADGMAFAKMLDGKHALQIQLRDVMGKAMPNRQVVIVTSKTSKTALSASASPIPSSASSSNTTDATVSVRASKESSPDTAIVTSGPIDTEPKQTLIAAEQATPTGDAQTPAKDDIPLDVKLVTTDSDGNIPAITTDQEQPVLIIVPREDYPEYAKAVASGEISEDAAYHEIALREGTPQSEELKTNSGNAVEPQTTSPAATPLPVAEVANAKPPQGVSNGPAVPPPTSPGASRPTAAKPSTSSTPGPKAPPIKKDGFTLEDAERACRKIGWDWACTGIAYIKQFTTKPKFPEMPFEYGPVGAPKIRHQSISSSANTNNKRDTTKNKGKVITNDHTAVNEVKSEEDAPWMVVALKEQKKGIQQNPARHEDDPQWKALQAERQQIETNNRALRHQLEKERRAKKPDTSSIHIAEQELATNLRRLDDIKGAQDKIIPLYENVEILKYFSATGTNATSDETAWCSAFVNWVLRQTGYKGTGDAAASSWLSWGEAADPPKYGSVIVVKKKSAKANLARTTSGYHVGFFVSQSEQKQSIKNKDGETEQVVVTRWKILGGNQGAGEITEVNFLSTTYEKVALRWPKK